MFASPFQHTRVFRLLAISLGVFGYLLETAQAGPRSKVPQQSILYVELTGSEATREARSKTAFGALLHRPDVEKLIDGAQAQLRNLLRSKGVARDAKTGDAVWNVIRTLWKKGFGISVIGMSMTPMGPDVSAVLACDIGDGAEDFLAQLEMISTIGELPERSKEEIQGHTFTVFSPQDPSVPPIRYGVVEGTFLILVGANAPQAVLATMAGEAPNIESSERLNAALSRTGASKSNTRFLLHLDVQEALTQARAVFEAMSGQPELPPPVAALVEELGIGATQSVTLSSHVAHKGYQTSLLVATKGPKKGLLKLAEQKPLTDEDLLWPPRDASMMSVINFDLAAAYDEIMRVLESVPGAPKPMVDAQLNRFEQETGLNLRNDILAVLADGWALFLSDLSGGVFFTGVTAAIEVTNEEAALGLLDRLAASLKDKEIKENIDVLTIERDGYTVRVFQLRVPLPFAPSWTVHKKRLVIGFAPQMVDAVMRRMRSDDPKARSILANDDFVRGRKLLPESLISVGYNDSRRAIIAFYPFLMHAAIAGVGYVRNSGADVNAGMVPSQQEIVEAVFGDVGGMTVDENGILQIQHGPLPVPVPGFASVNVTTTATLVSVLLPSLSRARELSKRVASGTNLKSIVLASRQYAQDEGEGSYPPDLRTLISSGYLTEDILVAPGDPTNGPSYTYIPGHTMDSDPWWVVAYEEFPHLDEGANVAFADGHVEFVKPLDRVRELAEQTRLQMQRRQ